MEKKYEYCIVCKTYHWTDENCPLIFYFKHENWGDEFQEITAYSFCDAAEEFAKLYNENGGYPLMDDNVDVIISNRKIEKKYNVSAEPDIHYSITEIG